MRKYRFLIWFQWLSRAARGFRDITMATTCCPQLMRRSWAKLISTGNFYQFFCSSKNTTSVLESDRLRKYSLSYTANAMSYYIAFIDGAYPPVVWKRLAIRICSHLCSSCKGKMSYTSADCKAESRLIKYEKVFRIFFVECQRTAVTVVTEVTFSLFYLFDFLVVLEPGLSVYKCS